MRLTWSLCPSRRMQWEKGTKQHRNSMSIRQLDTTYSISMHLRAAGRLLSSEIEASHERSFPGQFRFVFCCQMEAFMWHRAPLVICCCFVPSTCWPPSHTPLPCCWLCSAGCSSSQFRSTPPTRSPWRSCLACALNTDKRGGGGTRRTVRQKTVVLWVRYKEHLGLFHSTANSALQLHG